MNWIVIIAAAPFAAFFIHAAITTFANWRHRDARRSDPSK